MPVPQTSATATSADALPPDLRRVVLTGFMGAGKSTVGRALAQMLQWQFLDLDTLIEVHTGLSITDLFEQHGEAAFRRIESRMLAQALGWQRAVIALGGGAPETLTNRLLLEQTPGTRVIFLRAPFPTLFDRCMLEAVAAGAVHRPNLRDPALAAVRFEQRQLLYARIAHITCDTLDQTPDQAAEMIQLALRHS